MKCADSGGGPAASTPEGVPGLAQLASIEPLTDSLTRSAYFTTAARNGDSSFPRPIPRPGAPAAGRPRERSGSRDGAESARLKMVVNDAACLHRRIARDRAGQPDSLPLDLPPAPLPRSCPYRHL